MNTISISANPDQPHSSFCHISTAKGIYNIPLDDIFFIDSFQKKSILHTAAGILPLPIPLYRLKESLPASIFLQTHRSFLVNLKKISQIDKQKDPWTISFFGTEERAFISRSFRQQVIDAVCD